MQTEREARWSDIAQRNLVNSREALDKISIQDYQAAGVAMANGVIEREQGEGISIEAATAQLLWDSLPETADPAFVELVSGYRDALNEYVNRGSDV
jgi:hypothetical protein